MTVDPSMYKSPVIAQAIAQIIDRWFMEIAPEGGYYDNRNGDLRHVVIDNTSVDLDALGKYVAAQMGF